MSDSKIKHPVCGSEPGGLVTDPRTCSYLLSSLQRLLGHLSSSFGPLVVR